MCLIIKAVHNANCWAFTAVVCIISLQRNAIKASAVPVTNQFNIEEYGNRFPILKLPEPEPNTVLATFLYYIRKLLGEHRLSFHNMIIMMAGIIHIPQPIQIYEA